MSQKLYLVAYDIRCKRRMRQALNIMKDYSHARQKSVFECWLSNKELLQLRTRLAPVIDDEDSLLLTSLPLTSDVYYLGTAQAHDQPAIMIC